MVEIDFGTMFWMLVGVGVFLGGGGLAADGAARLIGTVASLTHRKP